MRKNLSAIILLIALFVIIYPVKAEYSRVPLTISVEKLNKNLNHPNLVLLHIGDKAEFDKAHIPGAQYISLRDIAVSRDNGKINTELPPVEDLQKTFEKFGVTDDSFIVLYYGNDWVSPTTRVYFTLDYLGLGDKVSILDGGMKAWIKAGNPTVTELKTPAVGSLKINPKKDLVAYAD